MKCSEIMFYRVFFDPDVIRPAYSTGATGLSLLLTIWRGFLLNCSVCEVDGYLVHERTGEILREIAKDAEANDNGLSDYITRLKKVLVLMEKQNRFVDVLSTSEADQSLALLALNSAESIGVDVILTDQSLPDEPQSPERTSFNTYAISNFERERAKDIDDGLIPEGAYSASDFFPKRFGKLLPLAKQVVIFDGILGRKFGDNFQYSLRLLIQYLESTNAAAHEFVLEIHTEDGERIDFLEQRLGEWCKKIQYKVHRHTKVVHERYLFTDQFGLQLGIGMDLLDRRTERNRGTDFSYSRVSKLKDLISS
jgi:hypothetical protein